MFARAGKGRSGSVMRYRFLWHNSSVSQQGAAHTGSTWTADGSQTGRRCRKGVDENDTPTTDSMEGVLSWQHPTLRRLPCA